MKMKRANRKGRWLEFVNGLLLVTACLYLGGMPIDVCRADEAVDFGDFPVEGMVTMIDLGAKKCIPCKMMAPIMVKMEKKYQGKAAIIFIDVWEHKEQAQRFQIRAIPTQIFFDASGAEVYRHVGFLGEKEITQVLEKLGVKL
jgi:thioredoxin 1